MPVFDPSSVPLDLFIRGSVLAFAAPELLGKRLAVFQARGKEIYESTPVDSTPPEEAACWVLQARGFFVSPSRSASPCSLLITVSLR